MPENDIAVRLLDYASEIVLAIERVKKTETGRHISRQLVRAATSAGANYEEACAAESRADFIHKLMVTLKELRESLYWLRLIRKLNSLDHATIIPILKEGDELSRIIGKSIVTARKRSNSR